MKAGRIRYFAANMDILSRRDRVFLNNPVIMQGLGLASIVVPATSLRNAVILAVAVILLLTPTRMLAAFIGRYTGNRFRALAYAITAGLFYIPVAYLISLLFGTATNAVGIYLPLLVMEPLILKRYGNAQRERVSTSFKKGIITTVGFCLVLFIVAAIREVLALGTLGGLVVFASPILPFMGMPAGGFFCCGLLSAMWRAAVNAFKKHINLSAKELV